jgi:hypothetical protein
LVFTIEVSTPANTLETSPLETVMDISEGLVYNVKVIFPPGSCGLLKCRIFDCSTQIWPTNFDGYFSGNNYAYDFDELYDKTQPPYKFVLKSWNTDDQYAHRVSIYIAQVSLEAYRARFLPGESLAEMTNIVSTLSSQQKTVAEKATIAIAEKYSLKTRLDH